MSERWRKSEAFLLKDKYLGLLVKQYGRCKIKKKPKKVYFEQLVREITGQQLSTKAARTIFGRVREKMGGEVTPEKILRSRKSTLRSCGLSNAKSAYIKDLAKHVGGGELEIGRLDKLTDKKVMEELVAVKGIGPWTAEMFLMFTLGRPDIFPVDDLGLKNALKRLLKRDLDPQEMEKFALRWKPHRTAASWYLWELLDN